MFSINQFKFYLVKNFVFSERQRIFDKPPTTPARSSGGARGHGRAPATTELAPLPSPSAGVGVQQGGRARSYSRRRYEPFLLIDYYNVLLLYINSLFFSTAVSGPAIFVIFQIVAVAFLSWPPQNPNFPLPSFFSLHLM